MEIVNRIGKFYFSTRLNAIDRFVHDPVNAQQRVLLSLLREASQTEYGTQYGFQDIGDYKHFQKTALHDYESLKPYFMRMQEGAEDVLWKGKIQWFAKSSGTTNDASKFIPVSVAGLHESHIKTGKDFLSLYLRNHPRSNFFTGKGLVMGGSYHPNQTNPDVFIGDVSAILMKNLDTWIQYFREPKLAVALMPDWETKLAKIAAVTMRQHVTSISGVPSWTLLLLRKALEMSGKKQIKDLWPGMELYCHGGVGFAPYRKQFDELIGHTVHYQNVYNASEGFFAFQDTLDCDHMLLHLDNGVYYEFIPFDGDLHYDQIVDISGVKKDVNYALVISTNSGLWRYLIGDTISFTDVAPYRIKITGRTKHYINVFGEEVTIDNTDQALAVACLETGAAVADYTVAPVFITYNAPGRHEWGIAFDKAPDDIAIFEKILDQKLQGLNSDYQAKRSAGMAMGNLKVTSLAADTFYRWLESKAKLGSQQKIPRLKNDRAFIEELIRLSHNLV